MKITMLELFHISIPFIKPYNLSKVYGTISDAQAVIIKVHTDEGIIGLGEADPMPPFTEESPTGVMVAIRDYLGPHLLGEDPLKVPVLDAKMERLLYGNYTSKGALNMALYDILGKAKGIPVHTLLGGAYLSEIPLLWPLGSGTPDEDIRQIEEKIEEGYRTIALKMGALPISEEVKRIAAIRRRFDPDIRIIVDANQGWEVGETLRFISAVEGYDLQLIEQPISRWNIKGLRRIRERSASPISADESLISVHDAANLIREDAVDVFSVKVSKNGGLSSAKKIATLAEGSGIKCLVNSMLEFGVTQAAALHLGCTMTNLLDCGHCYMSTLRLSDDITDFRDHIAGTIAKLPDGPGLCINIDDKKLKRYLRGYLKVD